jgi:hypothetical protein
LSEDSYLRTASRTDEQKLGIIGTVCAQQRRRQFESEFITNINAMRSQQVILRWYRRTHIKVCCVLIAHFSPVSDFYNVGEALAIMDGILMVQPWIGDCQGRP